VVNSTNTWDDGYPSGGNYWSNYQTTYPNAAEKGSSGIWNTPYVIDANNTDRYPLMGGAHPMPHALAAPFEDLLAYSMIGAGALVACLIVIYAIRRRGKEHGKDQTLHLNPETPSVP
jgi:hypothetical protein